MPSTLLFPNIIQIDNKDIIPTNARGVILNDRQHLLSPSVSPPLLSYNLEKESSTSSWVNTVTVAIGFGKQRKHSEKGCHQCDMAAMYYRQALWESRQYEMDELTLELVWQMTKMLLEHMETRLYHHLDWFDGMARDLWQYAKWLKEEKKEGIFENAIRITIYHCRAAIYHQDADLENIGKARIYYRKCLSLSTSFDTQRSFQNTASLFLSHHPLALFTPSSSNSSSSIKSNNSSNSNSGIPFNYFSLPPTRSQSTSPISITPSSISLSSATSTSSSSGIIITACGQCGLEKKAMPVCAKCKIQRYCGSKCLKDHQPIHSSTCQKRV